MLKVRILPTLLYRDVELVKGEGFDPWRRIGSVMQSIKVYNLREVDELVFLDISATRAGRPPDFALIDEIADGSIYFHQISGREAATHGDLTASA